jgi:hypothetical protein
MKKLALQFPLYKAKIDSFKIQTWKKNTTPLYSFGYVVNAQRSQKTLQNFGLRKETYPYFLTNLLINKNGFGGTSNIAGNLA